jgi:hypothetical protein
MGSLRSLRLKPIIKRVGEIMTPEDLREFNSYTSIMAEAHLKKYPEIRTSEQIVRGQITASEVEWSRYASGQLIQNFESWASANQDLVTRYLEKISGQMSDIIACLYHVSVLRHIASIQPVSDFKGPGVIAYLDRSGKFCREQPELESIQIEGDWSRREEYTLCRRTGRCIPEDSVADFISEISAESSLLCINKIIKECGNVSRLTVDYKPHDPTSVPRLLDVLVQGFLTLSSPVPVTRKFIMARGPRLVWLATLPSFTKLATGTSMGPQLYGYLELNGESVAIIKLVQPVRDDGSTNSIFLGYRGDSWIDSPIIFSPQHIPFVDEYKPFSALRKNMSVGIKVGVKIVRPQSLLRLDLLDG